MTQPSALPISELAALQQKVSEYLIADPAAMQIALLLQLNSCRLSQSLLAAANTCGCATLDTAPAAAPSDNPRDDFGSLCPSCRRLLVERIGALLFYTAALSNALGLELAEICDFELEKLDLLGYFMLGEA